MSELALEHGAAVRAENAIDRICAEIHAECRQLDGSVAALLDGSWGGVAADQYREGWDEWAAGAAELVGALGTLGRLMAAARTTIEAADGASADGSRLLVSRLGPLA
ncbi:hypothetical protein GCM10022237_17350 [Nocardioides ginsengisoli]|uniref:WXG100 family type VII secretion target n=1 Tax=Nocardioides ginsengisoli TaxID=363868 RepID=A0ABW3VYW2_9ACTN